MVEIFISVALDSAAIFLTFRHLSEENQSVTMPLGTQCLSLAALSIITNPRSLFSCGELLFYQYHSGVDSQASLVTGGPMAVLDQRFSISSNKSMYASQETPLFCANQAPVVDPTHQLQICLRQLSV